MSETDFLDKLHTLFANKYVIDSYVTWGPIVPMASIYYFARMRGGGCLRRSCVGLLLLMFAVMVVYGFPGVSTGVAIAVRITVVFVCFTVETILSEPRLPISSKLRASVWLSLDSQAAIARWLVILIGVEAGGVTAFFGLLTTQRNSVLGWTHFAAGIFQLSFAAYCFFVSIRRIFRGQG